MKRLVAGVALALATVPFASASALPPNRVVDCTEEWVVEETNAQRFLLCVNQRAAAGDGHVVDCFVQFVTRAEPVPQTLEERIEAALREVDRTVWFAGCVAAG